MPNDRSPTLFYAQGQGGDYITQNGTRLLKPSQFTFNVTSRKDAMGRTQGVSLSITSSDISKYFDADFQAPSGQSLVAGTTYENATRYPFNSSAEPGLSISGEHRGCNMLAGRFTVRQLSTDASGNIKQFVADFEQACEGTTVNTNNKLVGTVRYQSDLNFQ